MNVDTSQDRGCYFPRALNSFFFKNALEIIESENPF